MFLCTTRYTTLALRRIGSPKPSSLFLFQRRGMVSVSMSRPRAFPTTGYEILDPSRALEEENIPDYVKERYHPVHIGQVFKSQYQVIAKLGFGSSSTVWLCRDLHNEHYLTLKVLIRSRRRLPEVEVSKHLQAIYDVHAGVKYVRLVLDSLEISGPCGVNTCLLYAPAGIDIRDFMHCLEGDALPEKLLRPALRFVLVGLDYLHQAKVIHTDIQRRNVLLGIDDESILFEMEEDEVSNPAPRKQLRDRTIYATRVMPLTGGEPVVADLGEARIAEGKQTGLIMPSVYRTPEVWDHHRLSFFYEVKKVSITGTAMYVTGNWRDSVGIPEQSLESRESRFEGSNKIPFLNFLRKTLCWLPEERPTEEELLFDEWLRGDDY